MAHRLQSLWPGHALPSSAVATAAKRQSGARDLISLVMRHETCQRPGVSPRTRHNYRDLGEIRDPRPQKSAIKLREYSFSHEEISQYLLAVGSPPSFTIYEMS